MVKNRPHLKAVSKIVGRIVKVDEELPKIPIQKTMFPTIHLLGNVFVLILIRM